eukprot:TRINITY_DN9242_c0_g1_i1.p1 TRINITY_DN9242_c0_g1~~TRINITY_DN9242_c0_g1_i1.p1  ORF type:complete len:217 (-),score=38.14 TRINITY_DN9242_c0_g1_i1:181-831(-)
MPHPVSIYYNLDSTDSNVTPKSSLRSSRTNSKRSNSSASTSHSQDFQHYERMKEKKIDSWLKRFDLNGDGVFQRSELKVLMEELNDGMPVSKEDVQHIMSTCDVSRTGVINRHEIMFAVKLWTEHIEMQEDLAEWMAKYDVDKSGSLDKVQLKSLLYELNDMVEVRDTVVDWVMRHGDETRSGKLGPWELERAITAWRYRMFVKAQKQRSSVCAVL